MPFRFVFASRAPLFLVSDGAPPVDLGGYQSLPHQDARFVMRPCVRQPLLPQLLTRPCSMSVPSNWPPVFTELFFFFMGVPPPSPNFPLPNSPWTLSDPSPCLRLLFCNAVRFVPPVLHPLPCIPHGADSEGGWPPKFSTRSPSLRFQDGCPPPSHPHLSREVFPCAQPHLSGSWC